MSDAKLNDETLGEEEGEGARLHQLPLNKRKVRVNRKWAIRIGIILLVLVLADGAMMTVLFMMRKGMW